jgi:hypothetical protein
MLFASFLFATVGAPPHLAVLRSPEAPDVVFRVAAQLVDTAWRLEVGPRRRSAAPALEADLKLGQGMDAAAVIEVVPTRTGLRVRLTDVGRGRTYVRAVAGLDRTGSGPVTEEAAAVLLRDSLKALADIGKLAWTIEAERPSWHWEMGFHGCGSADGLGVASGAGLYLGMSRNDWVGAARVGLGWGRRRTLEGVTLTLPRHVVRLTFSRRFAPLERFFFEVGPSGGFALYGRATLAADGGTAAAPSATPAGLVGVAARAGVNLGQVRIWLAAGADAVLGAPAFEVSRGNGRTELGRGWPVAPWLTVGLSVTREQSSPRHDPIRNAEPSMSLRTGFVRP